MSFRLDYLSDRRLRLMDFIGHVSIAVFLNWVFGYGWWMQWLPDVCLLYLWPYSIITDRYLPEDNWVVKIHKKIHDIVFGFFCTYSIYTIAIFTLIGFKYYKLEKVLLWLMILSLHWMCHLSLDFFTHKRIYDRCTF